MSSCVIFGGSGFIGVHLAHRLLATGRFSHIHLADQRVSPLSGDERIESSITDVRKAIPLDLVRDPPEWIFNLAAVHREPGHEPIEYFETNLAGAENVTKYAEAIGCRNIYFTSSIAVYGEADTPTDESAPICPVSPYGASKYPAELIHQRWLAKDPSRRLVICRPGVVYGAGDPGNILRMIRAIRRGYFAYPGSPGIHKSYGYIEGLLDSIEFTMARDENFLCYNYVEAPTEPLGALVAHIKNHLSSRTPVFAIPPQLLLPAATLISMFTKGRGAIHPMRVRKAARPTHIVPAVLKNLGFEWRFDFKSSLVDWQRRSPEDFE